MRRNVVAIALAGVVAAAASAPAQAWYLGLFEPNLPPVSYDCGALAGELGSGAVWYGRYAGLYNDEFLDRTFPYSRQGCFPSEVECRVWQHQNLTYTNGGRTVATSCRPGIG